MNLLEEKKNWMASRLISCSILKLYLPISHYVALYRYQVQQISFSVIDNHTNKLYTSHCRCLYFDFMSVKIVWFDRNQRRGSLLLCYCYRLKLSTIISIEIVLLEWWIYFILLKSHNSLVFHLILWNGQRKGMFSGHFDLNVERKKKFNYMYRWKYNELKNW